MDFTVIIVTYNSEKDIIKCINSIVSYFNNHSIEIIIIDNYSKDNTRRVLSKTFANLRIVELPLNSGFAKAANIGSRCSNGKYLLFCNPDITFKDDIFSMAKMHFENERVGCITPKISSEEDIEQYYAFKFPDRRNLLSIIVGKVLNDSTKQKFQVNLTSSTNIIECDWILGACLIIPALIFNSVGKFDENFFLNYEEIDLCKRLKKLNYKVLADKNYVVEHKDGQSKKQLGRIRLLLERIKSENYYYTKHLER